MKNEEYPMAYRTIQILNAIINKTESNSYGLNDIKKYCMDVKKKIEKEIEKASYY